MSVLPILSLILSSDFYDMNVLFELTSKNPDQGLMSVLGSS